MRIALIILLFVSLNVSAQVDYLNLPLYNGVGYSTLTSADGQTISDVKFSNLDSNIQDGNALILNTCTNMVFERCYFAASFQRAVKINGGNTITFRNCFFANVNVGLRIDNTTGNIKIINCQYINLRGYTVHDPSLPNGDFHKGQFVQYANVTGAGNLVDSIRGINYEGEAYSEDLINCNGSDGTSGSPITISNCILVGGGPSASSGGIIFGDGSGQYGAITDNRLYNVGQYGGQARGDNVLVQDNQIYCEERAWSSIALYLAGCTNTTSSGNTAYALCGDDEYGCTIHTRNDYFNGGCTGTISAPGVADLGTMAIPDPLITFIDTNDVWKARSDTFFNFLMVNKAARTTGGNGDPPDPLDWSRPIANAGSDQNISISTATLTATATARQPPASLGGSSTNTVTGRWNQVSGPNTASMSAQTSTTNNLSGLIAGTYIFRWITIQDQDWNNDTFADGHTYTTYHSDEVQVTVSLAASGIKMPVKYAVINDHIRYKHNWYALK